MKSSDADPPRLPLVGEFVRGQGTLFAVEVIPPPPQPPPTTDYIFETIHAHWELRLHGNVVKRGETHNDHYGLGTSVVSIIRAAKKYASDNEITPTSDLEVVAIQEVSYHRRRVVPGENFYNREFAKFDHLERGSEWNVPETVETIVWSSKWPTEEAKEES